MSFRGYLNPAVNSKTISMILTLFVLEKYNMLIKYIVVYCNDLISIIFFYIICNMAK